MQNKQEAIAKLAEFMTHSPRVASHSMGLQLGGARKDEADAFFALRNSFGVEGYATADEAAKAITSVIGA